MKKNVGNVERVLRIVIGLALVVMAAMGTIGVWGYIGVIALVTGLMGSCPLYMIFGLGTCPLSSKT